MVKTGDLFLIAILIFSSFTLMGCTSSNVPSPPFSTSQFYSQVTDLNYSSVLNGDNNNQILIIKGTKVSVADANDLNVALPDLSAYVDWVDGNSTYAYKSDVGSKIGDVNCSNGDKVIGFVEGFSC